QGASEGDKALGESGLLAGVTSTKEIANAIIQLYESPTLRRKMGESGHRRVARYYSNEKLEQRYRELYTKYIRETVVV
ncbi:MAG: hypothetical protein DWQ10_16615, partial [Calditrichaeota bacterium]